jgi:hypothetical protein
LICSTHKIYCAIFESSLPNKSINFDIKPDWIWGRINWPIPCFVEWYTQGRTNIKTEE